MQEENLPEPGNPYATPKAPSPSASISPASASACFTDGKYLYVADGAVMPDVCLRTNNPVGPEGWRKRKLISWSPTWVYLLLLINILVVLIVALLTQKKGYITYSLSAPTHQSIVRKRIIALSAFLFSIGCFFALFQLDTGQWGAALGLLGVLSILFALIALVAANPIKAVRFKDGWFRIKGCSPEFLATLPYQASPM